jgi:beta-ureidopropionase / N-carbamoyl-L-amino-acid hydrolase
VAEGSGAADGFASLWRTLEPIGRDAGGGYLRYSLSPADLAARAWFAERAGERGLVVETDRNGNLWAWWGDPAAGGAIVTGSHLDSVPHGGGYDGPLGIVSALLAIDRLRERGVTPTRPLGLVVFAEEEGARFGVACLGSRLLCGALSPERARGLVDADGVGLVDAMAAAGLASDGLGPGADPDRLGRIATYVELHIEQGRHLADVDSAVGVAGGIWPHGRWRLDIDGEANHAGTTRMADRRDPMRTLARTVLAADEEARAVGAHAGVYRVRVAPNATNAVPSRATAWLDARAADERTLGAVVAAVLARAEEGARHDGTTVFLDVESASPPVAFDAALRERMVSALGGAPVLDTAAGHDAGVLAAAGVPAGMLFVRNPTGVSHAPGEHATPEDCATGVAALASVLADLVA